MAERSPYYWSHQSNEVGADNLTVTNNVFEDGGEIADVWLYNQNQVQGVLISGNEFNPSGSHAVAIYPGNTDDATIQDNTIVGGDDAIYLNRVTDFVVDNNDIGGVSDATSTGIYIFRGNGNITDNTLTDADGGMYLDSMTAPPALRPTRSVRLATPTTTDNPEPVPWNLASGKTAVFNLETDSWGYEISIEITKPDGTKDTWPSYSFNSNAAYNPLRAYTDVGNYTLVVADVGRRWSNHQRG